MYIPIYVFNTTFFSFLSYPNLRDDLWFSLALNQINFFVHPLTRTCCFSLPAAISGC